MSELERLEKLLEGYISRKKEELNLFEATNEIEIELKCADLFKYMIGVAKRCH